MSLHFRLWSAHVARQLSVPGWDGEALSRNCRPRPGTRLNYTKFMPTFVCKKPEAGRIVAMVPVASLAALICIGIGVDFSGQALAEQDLRDRATYCARQAAQAVELELAPLSQVVGLANTCLDDQGLTGSAGLNGRSLTVDVSGSYQTKLLSILAIKQLPVRGSASTGIIQGR